MTDEEKFRFDLQGFLVIPGVLSQAECSRLSSTADQVWPSDADSGLFRRAADVSRWGSDFLNLLDHPRVLPYLVELIGPRLRADHDYCIFMQPGAQAQPLHGGSMLYESDHWYHYQDGVMRNGLMVATWALTDALPGDGGFVCIPGSHKSNFLRQAPKDVLMHQRLPDYVHQPQLKAGDVLIFTEALIHGTATWQGREERRALLYKYSPPHSSWAAEPYRLQDYPQASPQQRRLLAVAAVENHAKVVDPGS